MQWEGEGTLCKVRGLLDSLASCGRHDHAGTHAPSVRDAGFITGLSRDGLDASRLASSAVSLFLLVLLYFKLRSTTEVMVTS